ncbi:MAG: RNA methyltransferase [Oscillospiraceae bacterium]|nr:RNA methyltransferase [Oscillospiraceae bacterium]
MEQQTVITSKDNSLIRRYRRICEDKRYRNTEHVFAAEGLRLVCEALQEGHCASLYVTESAYEKYADQLRDGITKPVIISDALGKYLSETEHPQGVFALCYTTRTPLRRDSLRRDGRYLVLYELQDPGNMGMILRTADAFGIDAVLTYQCCDVFSPKVVRATMGAIFRMPVIEAPQADVLRLHFEEKGIRSYAAVLHPDAQPVTKSKLGKGCAVWIGNEGNGLSAEAVDACDEKLIIPMQGNAESLNAAMAAGILMWEMVRK